MATLGDDCYFFCTSTCAKGAACPFRHVESAKTCRVICQHWQMGGCLRPMCKFRHSDFVLQLDTIDVPCFWESLPAGCAKKNCIYKHLKPRPFDDVVPAAAGSVPVESSSVGTAQRNDVNTPQTFVQPVVTPVIIQNLAESEESNSSPMKRPPEATQEPSIPTLPRIQELEEPENNKLDEEKLSDPTKEQTVEKKKKIVKSGVKKMKQKIAVQKTPKKVARKNSGKLKSKSLQNNNKPQKSVKMRLGKAPSRPEPVIQSSSSESSGSESESESDDSIENIQVMSMEDILRQKALESMMRKRATERKPSTDKKLPPPEGKKTPPKQQKSPPVAKNVKKQASTVRRVKHVPAPVESSSSSSEENSEEEDPPKQSSEKSSSSSSNASSDSSSSDSEEDTAEDSDELDVRRVVVNREIEKAARNKAKASFLKKQKLNAANLQSSRNKEQVSTRLPPARKSNHMPLSALNKDNNRGRQQNKHHVNVDYDSDDIISSRVTEPLKLNVRDRLGKSTTLHNSSSSAHLLSRRDKFGSSVALSKAVDTKKRNVSAATSKMSRSSSGSSSEDDSDSLADVKVKTLEEIRLEKMRKQSAEDNRRNVPSQARVTAHRHVPVKQRLGKIPAEKQDSDVDNMKGRQVVLVNDTGSKSDDASNRKTLDEQKRAKKRPWRSQKRNIDLSSADIISGDGERTTVIASPPAGDDYTSELKSYKKVQIDEESPFEKLRRKALMKKLESSRMLKQPLDGGDADSEILKAAEMLEDDGADTKTLKHNHHHHKHHRRVKVDRQIYMPPGMKNTVPEPSQTHEPVSPKKEPVTGPATNVSPLKRGPHPIAAAWSAGLSLSSKGVIPRRPEPTPISARISVDPIIAGRSTGLTLSSRGVAGRPMTAPNSGNSVVSARPAGLLLSANAKKCEQTVLVNSEIAGKLDIGNRLGIKEITKPKETVSYIETSQPSESSGVTIKSFSEIMAEKRKRRMEMLAQKSGATIDSTSSISDIPSLPSSTSLSSFSSESNSTSSKKANVGAHVPISPIVFAPGKSSGSTFKSTVQADSLTNSSVRITAQPTVSNTHRVSPAVPILNVPPTVSSLPHNTTITTDKIKLKSVNNSKNNKGKKLFIKKNSKEQIDIVSEDSRNNLSISSSRPCTATSIESETVSSIARVTSQEASSHHNRTSKAFADAVPSHQNFSHSNIPASQTAGLDAQAKLSAHKFSIKIDTPPAVKVSAPSTRKANIPAPAVEPEPINKKTRLSIMEDEFNFFGDEYLDMDDGIIPEDIEPIDNLLQDIDDLLS